MLALKLNFSWSKPDSGGTPQSYTLSNSVPKEKWLFNKESQHLWPALYMCVILCTFILTRYFLPERTSIKISGIISSIRKLLIRSSINLLECLWSHMCRQSTNLGPFKKLIKTDEVDHLSGFWISHKASKSQVKVIGSKKQCKLCTSQKVNLLFH